MIILDTSVWIEFLRQTDQDVSAKVALFFERGEVLGLEPVFGELLQGARDSEEVAIILEFWNSVAKIEENELFLKAGRLSARYKLHSRGLGLIDAFILTAAIENGCQLWTLDKKLAGVFATLTNPK